MSSRFQDTHLWGILGIMGMLDVMGMLGVLSILGVLGSMTYEICKPEHRQLLPEQHPRS